MRLVLLLSSACMHSAAWYDSCYTKAGHLLWRRRVLSFNSHSAVQAVAVPRGIGAFHHLDGHDLGLQTANVSA